MTKYFSVDISSDIHIINLCETLEQARETCPEYEPSIAITRYDADLGGWIDYADDEISHWQPLPPPPTE